MAKSQALKDVLLERVQQDLEWGVQRHSLSQWVLILAEEVGECSKAVMEGDRANYREEMVQVAAVALAAVESFDAGSREL